MSYLVEQPPYCDLLRLSLLTRRFVRFGRTHLRMGLAGLFGSLVAALLGAFFLFVRVPSFGTLKIFPQEKFSEFALNSFILPASECLVV